MTVKFLIQALSFVSHENVFTLGDYDGYKVGLFSRLLGTLDHTNNVFINRV